jgi:hypothetical protein
VEEAVSTPLYALTGRYAELLELAATGEDVTDALAALDDALEAKANGIVRVLAQLDADQFAAAAEAKRLAARAKAFEAAGDKLREYIKTHMRAANITRIKSAQFSITLADGQPRVEVHDLDALPGELVRTKTTREADKPAILKLHRETGEIPPGTDIVPTTKLLVR